MNQSNGFIYVRLHESYDIYDACKIGVTNNIPDRDSQYATGEIKRGNFEIVFKMSNKISSEIEKNIHKNFKEFNIKFNSGREFYNKKIIPLIEPYLIELGINYILLSKEKITNLIRCYRIRKTMKKINIKTLINYLKCNRIVNKLDSYIPRMYQKYIIEDSYKYFQNNNKGLLVLTCGVGKSLISLWIIQKLNFTNILIGVPNILLLEQWKKIVNIIFPDIKLLVVYGDIYVEKIMTFLENNNKKCILITTYASSYKVYEATRKNKFVFDMKVYDEVHHLTTRNLNIEGKTYSNILKIESKKQLSLTATLKILENQENKKDEDIVISNDNIEYFGEIIDRKGLLWAINENIICDYDIETLETNEDKLEQHLEKFNITEENDKRLFLSAYASLLSINIEHSHHLLIYSNKQENCIKIVKYIKILLEDKYFNISELYYSDYHSDMNSKKQINIINEFEKAKFGIITCVYCLGEGWDFPLLDGVVFAENMTSNIRIVQSALRGSRKNKNDINKKTKIILPILNRDDWLENNDNQDLKKVREVIYQMGLEDETISQKIKVFKINIEKQKPKSREKYEREMVDEFGEYDDELTQKLRLKTTKRTILGTTYEKARKIIADKNIKDKESYYELCEKDNRLPINPEEQFAKFTNWIEYLSIERVYYDLETCKNKVGKYLISYPDIKKHYLELSIVSKELCKIDTLFPPNGLWVEYYNVKDLIDIITITNKKKKIGAIL